MSTPRTNPYGSRPNTRRREVIDARGSIDSRTFDETREISAVTSDKRDRSKVIIDHVPDRTSWHSQAGQGFSDYNGGIRTPRPSIRQQRSKVPWVVILIIALVVLFFALFFMFSQSNAAGSNQGQTADGTNIQGAANDPAYTDTSGDPATQGQASAGPVQFTVTFAGDCTLGTDEAFDYNTSLNAMYYSVGDPAYFLRNVADIFSSDDLTVVNMEGTLTESTERQDKTFAFKGPAEFASILSSSSVETASMANNHSQDYGEQSYNDTIAALDAAGISTFGYDRIAYFDIKGVKVALVGTYELAEGEGIKDSMCANIARAREEGAQVVMVYIHWGMEREYVPNETQIYLGHAAIDAGADLVVGSHPHVIQGYEVYNGRYIVYSLGNFCFGGNSGPSDMDCMMFQQTFTVNGNDVEKNDNVNFIACSISSTPNYNNYQPTPATGDEKARIDAKIQESTNAIASMVG